MLIYSNFGELTLSCQTKYKRFIRYANIRLNKALMHVYFVHFSGYGSYGNGPFGGGFGQGGYGGQYGGGYGGQSGGGYGGYGGGFF